MVRVPVKRHIRRIFSLLKPYQGRFLFLLLVVLLVESSLIIDKYLFKLVIDDAGRFAAGTLARDAFTHALLLLAGIYIAIIIARALLANKHLLILDEATSALDSKTEHEIQQDLQRLMDGRTSIIIAHRLSTIMHADLIVVLENGRIVQQGTHQELIKHGVYKHLWELQKGGFI